MFKSYLVTIFVHIVCYTKSFRKLVNNVMDNEPKSNKYSIKNSPKNIFILMMYSLKCLFILKFVLSSSINFFEALKYLFYAVKFKGEEEMLFLQLLDCPDKFKKRIVNDNKILKFYYKCLEIFEVSNYISLLFTLFSKTIRYIPSARLTELENKILGLLFLGYSREDICKTCNISHKTTLSSHLNNVYKKLGVNSMFNAMMSILKETDSYKEPKEIVSDRGKFQVTVHKDLSRSGD